MLDQPTPPRATTYPPNGTKGLIAGLLERNQWVVISPDQIHVSNQDSERLIEGRKAVLQEKGDCDWNLSNLGQPLGNFIRGVDFVHPGLILFKRFRKALSETPFCHLDFYFYMLSELKMSFPLPFVLSWPQKNRFFPQRIPRQKPPASAAGGLTGPFGQVIFLTDCFTHALWASFIGVSVPKRQPSNF